jgi:hypothetical protein
MSYGFRFCLGLVVLLALANPNSVKMAQPIDQCPKITIECASPDDCSGPEFEVKLTISGTRPTDKLTYNWSTSAGIIASGQGTPSIKVDSKGADGQTITATVEVDGLELGCEKTVSFSQPIRCGLPPSTRLFDRYGDMSFNKEKERLDNLAIQLQQETGSQGYIIVYGVQLKRAERARKYLVTKRGIDPDRLEIIEGGDRHEATVELWVRPNGAEAPTADPTAPKNF